MAAKKAWLQDFWRGYVCVTCPKVSLHGGLQLGLRLRDKGSMELQSLCATGKVSTRELSYEMLFVWDIWKAMSKGCSSSKVRGKARVEEGRQPGVAVDLSIERDWPKCGAKRT